ncbi:MAG: carbohydrate binding family 9 domain-containing protein, partial [Cyclobacteriaceae bacterium]
MQSLLRSILIFCCAPFAFEAIAQTDKNAPVLLIKRTDVPIKIDGILNEEAWLGADSTQSFHQQFPYDSSLAQMKTVVRATYDDHFIYFAAKLYTEDPEKFVVPSLRRDFFGGGIDLFAIILDSFQDKTNAFTFGTNPAGVQREGLVSSGGVGGNDGPPVDFTWDNKWYNEVGVTHNAWIYEIAIPFK